MRRPPPNNDPDTIRHPVCDRLEVLSLTQMIQDGSWRMSLAHDQPRHMLVWVTRGQGRAFCHGVQRGVGPHNALFIPAHDLFALDLGRQGIAQVLLIPPTLGLPFPSQLRHLRIRDVALNAELSGLLEALGREQTAALPRFEAAMLAYGELIAIWMRRQLALSDDTPTVTDASVLLTRSYCSLVVSEYASGAKMSEHAAMLGVTPTHLTRVCKAQTGRTASRLLSERLLHESRRLLSDTNVPVKDIARHLNFGSPAYFSRFIQLHTGHSATALRRGKRLQ